jgi:asparagine synthase (glutamine-hydrolysing)
MTLFVGVLAPHAQSAPIAPEVIAELRQRLSRHAGDRPREHVGPGYAFLWIDLGLHPGRSDHVDETGAITLLAGDPLFAAATPDGDDRAIAAFHGECREGRQVLLRSARGSFCAMHFDPVSRKLWLVGDKLGLRPIYYSLSGTYVVFATSMRVIDGCSLVPPQGDLQAVAEIACFGYPLGGRSPRAAVRSIEPNQVVEVTPGDRRTFSYWCWDEVPVQQAEPERICQELSRVFEDSIRIRLGSRARVVSMLSGGLDSRCVVACLRAAGVDVDTINFGPEGSADLILGRQAAQAMGTRHFEAERGVPDFWDRLAGSFESWRQRYGGDYPGQSCRLLWSGEGGDRVLAPVNLSATIVKHMRAGRLDEAVSTYMRAEQVGLPRRLFRSGSREKIRGLPRAGMRAQLDLRTSEDPARRFHLYVLLNESRRNIYRHFEDLDLNRYDLVMPFYDSEMVRLALSFQFDPFIGHRLYYQWLNSLPPAVTQVPWQAYPSAPRCPLPLPPDVRLQWSGWYSRSENFAQWRSHVGLAEKLLCNAHFPDRLLNRPILSLARLFLRLGIRRFGYVFEVAQPFVKYRPENPDAA